MKEFSGFIADWLKGKPIFPVASRIISVLFCISISSFIFEKAYFEYTWFDISDYKSILNFFIKGSFFIPFSIFIIVYGLTYIASFVLFISINRPKIEKLERKIMNYELNKPLENLTGSWIIEVYKAFKTRTNPQLSRFFMNLEKRKMNTIDNFIMAIRGLIAITIYFSSLKYFGGILYLIIIIVTIGYLYLLLGFYRLYDLIPTLIRKFKIEVENYIKEQG